MPKVSDKHREQRRQQILAAALRCFARKGFHETSMSEIIAESGLSAGAIYGHFTGKSDLVADAAAEVFSRNAEALHATRGSGGEPAHPLDFAAGITDSMIGTVGGSVLPLQVWGEAVLDDDVRQVFDVVYGRLQVGIRSQIFLWLTEVKHLSAKQADSRVDTLTTVTLGLLQGGVVQSALVPKFDRGAYLRAAHPIFDTIPTTYPHSE